MSGLTRYLLSLLAACAMLGASGPAPVVAAESWHEELTRQIAQDEDCEVSFISHVVERNINGRHLIMAKVHCEDKRTFDAYRGDDDEAFQFKACEAPDAETC